MTLKKTGFEGTVVGDTISASNGGTGNDAPSLGTLAGTPTAVYSSLTPAHGTRCVRITAAAASQWRGYWSDTVAQSSTYRMYFRPLATPSVPTAIFNIIEGTSFGNLTTIALTQAMQITVQPKTGSAVTMTPVLAVDTTPYRIEVTATLAGTPTSTNGSLLVQLFDNDNTSTLTSGTYSVSNVDLGTVGMVRQQFGKTSGTGTLDALFDDCASDIGGATALGPALSALTLSASPSPTSGNRPLTTTVTVTPSGGTGTTITYTYVWGDGTTNTVTTNASATHTYASSGTFSGTVSGVNA